MIDPALETELADLRATVETLPLDAHARSSRSSAELFARILRVIDHLARRIAALEEKNPGS